MVHLVRLFVSTASDEIKFQYFRGGYRNVVTLSIMEIPAESLFPQVFDRNVALLTLVSPTCLPKSLLLGQSHKPRTVFSQLFPRNRGLALLPEQGQHDVSSVISRKIYRMATHRAGHAELEVVPQETDDLPSNPLKVYR
jgi:hypothetical protein